MGMSCLGLQCMPAGSQCTCSLPKGQLVIVQSDHVCNSLNHHVGNGHLPCLMQALFALSPTCHMSWACPLSCMMAMKKAVFEKNTPQLLLILHTEAGVLAGMAASKKWKYTVRIQQDGRPIGTWLEIHGYAPKAAQYGSTHVLLHGT